jgi:hypothetical protein
VPQRLPDLQRAAGEALHRRLGEMLTEPLMIKELARLFRCDRSSVDQVLKGIRRKQRVGQRWRVSVWAMPPEYLQRRGLLPRG